MTRSSKLVSAAAVASLALSPVAAQAGTRAANSPVAVNVQANGSGEESQLAAGAFSIKWLLLLLAFVAAVVAAAGGGGRSRG